MIEKIKILPKKKKDLVILKKIFKNKRENNFSSLFKGLGSTHPCAGRESVFTDSAAHLQKKHLAHTRSSFIWTPLASDVDTQNEALCCLLC